MITNVTSDKLFYNINMATKKKYDPSLIRGISIYQDNGRTLYAPFYSKKAYIMTQNNAAHYINYIVGYIAAMVFFEIAYIFSKDLLISILIAIAVLIANFLFFYFNFIKKAGVLDGYKKEEKDGFILRQAKQLEYDRIYTLIICCILLVVIFYFYALWQDLEGIYLYIIVLSIIASAVYGLVNLAILLRKRKLDSEKKKK